MAGRREKASHVRQLVASRPSGRADSHGRTRSGADPAAHAEIGVDAGDEIRPAAVTRHHGDRPVGAIDRALQASHAERLVDKRRGRGFAAAPVLGLGAWNAALETGVASALDEAITNACTPDISQARKLGEVPFDFVRKRVTVVMQAADRRGW